MREGSVIEYVRACVPPRIICTSSSFKEICNISIDKPQSFETVPRFIADREIRRESPEVFEIMQCVRCIRFIRVFYLSWFDFCKIVWDSLNDRRRIESLMRQCLKIYLTFHLDNWVQPHHNPSKISMWFIDRKRKSIWTQTECSQLWATFFQGRQQPFFIPIIWTIKTFVLKFWNINIYVYFFVKSIIRVFDNSLCLR